MNKKELRSKVRQDLRLLSESEKREQSTTLLKYLKKAFELLESQQSVKYVAWFVGSDLEVDLRALHPWLTSKGVISLLPKVEDAKSGEMSFYQVSDLSCDLSLGSFGIQEPVEKRPKVELNQIDVWVCPGVAFDKKGNRLGQGGGFYDRALAQRKTNTNVWGVAFDCQLVDELQVEVHDHQMDRVFTQSLNT